MNIFKRLFGFGGSDTPEVDHQIKIDEKKKATKENFLIKCGLRIQLNSYFWANRTEEDCYSFSDEDGNSIDTNVNDIVPFRRIGDFVFFYRIVGSQRKYGDYGFSDYAWFYDLEYNHSEKIPLKEVDPKKSLKITWVKVDEKLQQGSIQGIRIINLKISKRSYGDSRIEATYIKRNFSNPRNLPNYYDHYRGLTEAKKKIQQKVNGLVKNGVDIAQFYIPHKIRKSNS